MSLGQLLEACRVHEDVALKHSSKSTKYELEGSYDDLVHEHPPSSIISHHHVAAYDAEEPEASSLATKGTW